MGGDCISGAGTLVSQVEKDTRHCAWNKTTGAVGTEWDRISEKTKYEIMMGGGKILREDAEIKHKE